MSQRTAATGIFSQQLGSSIYLGQIATPNNPNYYTVPHPPTPPVRVVGIYRPRNVTDPFWFGQDYFDARPGAANNADVVDSLFVARSEFTSRKPNTYVEADLFYPITPPAVRLNDVTTERDTLGRLLAHYNRGDQISAASDLPGVLDAATREKHLVDIGTLLVTLQLSVLAWFVLFQVAADAIAARGNEIAMAKLRGLSPAATVRFGLGEPVLVLAAAVPIGIGLAVAITHGFAASTFAAGIPVKLTWAPVFTALIAFAGALTAAVVGGYQTLTRSVLEQWRGTTRRPGHGRLMLVIDVLLAAGAVVGLVVLRTDRRAGNENDTAALLAPGLLVFTVAILGVRLLPLSCRWLAHLTRASRRVGTFLAARQVARRPAGLRLAALLAVAAGLATFAVAGESIAAGNRASRAEAELGATRVASVQFDPGLDPVTATHQADPGGKWAMTAATWLPDGGDSIVGTVLGIDAPRFAAVAYTGTSQVSPTALAAALAPPVPPVLITTRQMRVHLTATGMSGDVRPTVQLNFRTAKQPALNAEGGAVQDGAHSYLVPVSCTGGCLLRGITWDRPISAQGRLAGAITLTGLDVRRGLSWEPIDIGRNNRLSWHPGAAIGQASDHVTINAAGIRDDFTSVNGGYGGIGYSADPSPMPAVATPRALAGASAPKAPQVLDTSNTTAYFHVVRTATVLPAVLDNGVLMDLRALQDELPAFVSEANWQVWLGPHAPPDALDRLASSGLQVQSVQTERDRVKQLARQAPALALLLLLVCGIAGAVLAAGGTAISISASGRRRAYEVAALRVIGVRRGALLRAGVAEQLLLLGTAVVLGVPTGLLAARVAMPAIPEFADPTPVTLHYTPQLVPMVVFTTAFVALLTLTACISAQVLIRVALPSRLRTTE